MEKYLSEKEINEFLKDMAKQLYGWGLITDDDIKDKRSLFKSLKGLLDSGFFLKMDFAFDHRSDLLNQAQYFQKKENYDFARVFYATYFEHFINNIIDHYCQIKNINQKSKTEIIKNVNIGGKFTWLLELLNLPAFDPHYLKVIQSLADKRNAFIHYKWKPDSGELFLELEKEKFETEFKEIENVIRYVKKYERDLKFKGNDNQIESLLK